MHRSTRRAAATHTAAWRGARGRRSETRSGAGVQRGAPAHSVLRPGVLAHHRLRRIAIYASQSWRAELETAIGPVMSWVIPTTLAYIPGASDRLSRLHADRNALPPPNLKPPTGAWPPGEWPAVTLIVAARDEEHAIVETLERFAELSYPGPLEIVLADNGSTDRTAERADVAALRLGLRFRRILEPSPGKHRALNTALATVTTPLVATVDADTLLHREALARLIARTTSRPQGQHVCACAGALVARNGQTNFLTRMQGWDYRLAINGVKRMQAAYNSALVLKGRSRRTGRTTSERWAAGPMRSVRTSS